MIRAVSIITVAIFILCAVAYADDLNPEVYPSEDELYEAYLRGDLDFETYRNLVDLIETGLDSTNLYLLDELPGVSPVPALDSTGEGAEREAAFRQPNIRERSGQWHGYLKARASRVLEDTEEYKSYYFLNSDIGTNWNIKAKLNRGESGIYEWTQRSAEYNSRRGPLKKFHLGSFNARFGSGLNLGFRGRLLTKGDEESDESIIFPDFSGYNGLYLEGSSGRNPARWLLHLDQNDTHKFRMSAISLSARHDRISGELIGLGAILENRQTGKEYKYVQAGTYVTYDAYDYRASGEIAVQQYTQDFIGAALIEGSYDVEPIELQLSLWHYADDFINFTGGGRSGQLYQTVVIDSLDFSLSDRRTGQDGFRLKSETGLSDRIKSTVAVSSYGFDDYHKKTEFYASVAGLVQNNSFLTLDYRYKRSYDIGDISSGNETRLEYKLRQNGVYLRTYIGYQNDDIHDYAMMFVRASGEVPSVGMLELWCNLDKINLESHQLDYMYLYVQEKIPVRQFLHIIAKYSYRYSRSYTDRQQSTFYIEGRAIW